MRSIPVARASAGEAPASNAAPVIFSVALDVPSVNSEALDSNGSNSDAMRYRALLIFAGCLLPLAWVGSAIFFTIQYGKMQGYQIKPGEQDVYNYAVVVVVLGLFVSLLSTCLYCSGSFILRKIVELLFAFGMLGYATAVGFHFSPTKYTYASYSLPVASWVVASFVFLIFWIAYAIYAIRMHYSKASKIPWFCSCLGKSSSASSSRPTSSNATSTNPSGVVAKSDSKDDEPVFIDASYIEIVKEGVTDYDVVDEGVFGTELTKRQQAVKTAAAAAGGGKKLMQNGGSGDFDSRSMPKSKGQVEEKEENPNILTTIFCGQV